MGHGQRKIQIKKIEKPRSRWVTFSKRKDGLFKKARKYAATTGSQVAVLAFSPSGKTFVLGIPSFEAVIESYLNGGCCESEKWEALVGLEEKVKAAETVEELMEMKKVLKEVRATVLKRLKDLENDEFVRSLLNI